MNDPFALDRFVAAQRGVFDTALAEIRRGAKRGHWMWYVFPQLAGLGRSAVAEQYSIRSLEEACAYRSHPLLGPRLAACVAALEELTGTTAVAVFGQVDAMKLRSSLTLFVAAGAAAPFPDALERWFGTGDEATLRLLAQAANDAAQSSGLAKR